MAKRGGDASKMVRVAEGIYRRNGVYVVPVWNPYKNEGRGGRDWHGGIPSLDEARDVKREEDTKRRQRGRGGRETVASFVRRWTTDPAWQRPAESTNLHNAERVRAFARDFGHRLLSEISTAEAQLWASGGVAPPGLAREAATWDGSVVRPDGEVEVRSHRGNVPAVLAMFSDAVHVQALQVNPFKSLRLPGRRGRRDIDVLSEAELELLIECAHKEHGSYGPEMEALINVAAGTGARPGELFALMANRVDVGTHEVQILEQYNAKLRKFTATKNELRRTVVYLPRADASLRRLLASGRGERLFVTKRGHPYTARSHHYYWDPVRRRFTAELPADHWLPRRIVAARAHAGRTGEKINGDLDFYELRHYFGTALAEAGASQYEIAQQMGHRDNGQTAAKHYIHIDRERARERLRGRFWSDEARAAAG